MAATTRARPGAVSPRALRLVPSEPLRFLRPAPPPTRLLRRTTRRGMSTRHHTERQRQISSWLSQICSPAPPEFCDFWALCPSCRGSTIDVAQRGVNVRPKTLTSPAPIKKWTQWATPTDQPMGGRTKARRGWRGSSAACWCCCSSAILASAAWPLRRLLVRRGLRRGLAALVLLLVSVAIIAVPILYLEVAYVSER